MAWRTVAHDGTVWHVSLAAERPPHGDSWQLVLTFRAATPGGRSYWIPYPLSASAKTTLFAHAERIPDHELAALVAQHAAGTGR